MRGGGVSVSCSRTPRASACRTRPTRFTAVYSRTQHIRHFFCGDDAEHAPFSAKAAASITAGGVGQAIATPFDLVEVRMQGDGRLVAAKKLARPRYSGLFDALGTIAKREGMLGFYAGSSPAIQRACLVNFGELTT